MRSVSRNIRRTRVGEAHHSYNQARTHITEVVLSRARMDLAKLLQEVFHCEEAGDLAAHSESMKMPETLTAGLD